MRAAARSGFAPLHEPARLDLTVADRATIDAASQAIERRRATGRVLVCCALGYSRSATAVAAWLVATGRAPDASAAVDCIRRVRPQVVLTDAHLAVIASVAPRHADASRAGLAEARPVGG